MISLAYLGPTGTNAETTTLAYADWLTQIHGQESFLSPYPSIAQALHSVAREEANLAVVPIENSIEGSVAVTLDTVWELNRLKIQQALVLPIAHALISCANSLEEINTVYSHPQALGQCQKWLDRCLPKVQLIPTNSTTESLKHLERETTAGVIAAPRAAKLYNLPILANYIGDYPDNCTRFWVLGLNPITQGSHVSLAFSLPANIPGALVKPLQVFAGLGINLSRIESRPTKRSLGEYIFFIDLQANDKNLEAALVELSSHTENLKIFGHYNILSIQEDPITQTFSVKHP